MHRYITRSLPILLALVALVAAPPARRGAAHAAPPVRQADPALTYLKASNTDWDDSFGAVTIDGDTMVVGAPGEGSASPGINGDQADNSLAGAGAAYVFVRSGTAWTQQAYLKPTTPQAGATFGMHVAIAGDTIVIAAPGEPLSSAPFVGAVYVFVRSGSTWTQQARLTAPTRYANGHFGDLIALAPDLLVVSQWPDPSDPAYHHITTFARRSQTWTLQTPLHVPGISSMALTAQWLVLGNELEAGTGAVHVYQWAGTGWQHQARLAASNADHNDRFGRSVAIGPHGIVVGAPYEQSATIGVNGDPTDNSLVGAGAAYLFGWTGDRWVQQAYFKASNSDVWDTFGESIVASGDWIVIGTPAEDSGTIGTNGPQTDNSQPYAGAAYLFRRTGTTWRQWFYQKASNTEAEDFFSEFMAMSGDTLAIGVPREDSCARGLDGNQQNNDCFRAGAVYVLTIPPDPDLVVRWHGQVVSHGDGTPTVPTRLGITAPGQLITRTFTLDNEGNSPLLLTGSPPITFTGDPAFRVVTQPAAALAPFSSTAFQVQFAPTSTGVATATLRLAANDPDAPVTELIITGVATTQPPVWLPIVGHGLGR